MLRMKQSWMQIICCLSEEMNQWKNRWRLLTVQQNTIHYNWTRRNCWIKWFWLDNYTQLNLHFPVRLHIFSVNFLCLAKLGRTDGLIPHLNESYQTKSLLKARMNVVWICVNAEWMLHLSIFQNVQCTTA